MRHRRTAPSRGRRPLLSPLLPGERTRNAWQLDSGSAAGLAPHAYTPIRLADRIRTAAAVIEGERKHITVLFADLRNSMELHAANAAIGVATAQLYPTITLSASWTLQTATAECCSTRRASSRT